mmetsp:Transcript_26528/g.36639  ORF Transcript_26528/g.36639 Transcript_26528/m.36639 type:complete len:369 (-) Transcript_26528:158-1264(-)|eukprot:CAMPEP_0196572294 /NCGR_PEP_ID=MMETSP1081-20130531/2368_1 /TAXON_ID=36882 /ORGANISM="Pyramimonas amylifera, Strain CCMP720" /LENGTH=368 /DNA_ID=CAMNT_0041889569 /DNA_START=126 /DNA_END=1232 /DNA_ORIENTATION=-
MANLLTATQPFGLQQPRAISLAQLKKGQLTSKSTGTRRSANVSKCNMDDSLDINRNASKENQGSGTAAFALAASMGSSVLISGSAFANASGMSGLDMAKAVASNCPLAVTTLGGQILNPATQLPMNPWWEAKEALGNTTGMPLAAIPQPSIPSQVAEVAENMVKQNYGVVDKTAQAPWWEKNDSEPDFVAPAPAPAPVSAVAESYQSIATPKMAQSYAPSEPWWEKSGNGIQTPVSQEVASPQPWWETDIRVQAVQQAAKIVAEQAPEPAADMPEPKFDNKQKVKLPAGLRQVAISSDRDFDAVKLVALSAAVGAAGVVYAELNLQPNGMNMDIEKEINEERPNVMTKIRDARNKLKAKQSKGPEFSI